MSFPAYVIILYLFLCHRMFWWHAKIAQPSVRPSYCACEVYLSLDLNYVLHECISINLQVFGIPRRFVARKNTPLSQRSRPHIREYLSLSCDSSCLFIISKNYLCLTFCEFFNFTFIYIFYFFCLFLNEMLLNKFIKIVLC